MSGVSIERQGYSEVWLKNRFHIFNAADLSVLLSFFVLI